MTRIQRKPQRYPEIRPRDGIEELKETFRELLRIFEDKDIEEQFGPLDYRSNVSGPVSASIEPDHVGEEFLDTSAEVWYKAAGVTLNSWKAINS